MGSFIYETHLHTAEASACATTRGADYIAWYKNAGYAGIFVTDHFFNGNCAVPRSLDWHTKVDLYCRGYENALEEAKNVTCGECAGVGGTHGAKGAPFNVFFGIEYNFEGDEYLLYGVTKEWLHDMPNVLSLSHRELFTEVDRAGGLMVQAHPFRMRDYISAIHLHPNDVHAVEVANAANKAEENDKAALYAAEHKLPGVAGSDMHNATKNAGELLLFGTAFDEPLESVNDYVSRVKSGNCAVWRNKV